MNKSTVRYQSSWAPPYVQYIQKDFYPQQPDVHEQHRQNTIRSILFICLINGLLLIAPIMAFYAEQLYQYLRKKSNDLRSIFDCQYPQGNIPGRAFRPSKTAPYTTGNGYKTAEILPEKAKAGRRFSPV
jgi:isoleucyl-tRNA synthetase